MRYLVFALLLLVPLAFASNAYEDVSNIDEFMVIEVEGAGGPIWYEPTATLYDNGPLINSPGTGFGGADESILQSTSLGMNTLGFGHQITNDNRIADDFVIPTGDTWDIIEITFFAYQSFAPSSPSPITNYHVQIWDDAPTSNKASVLWGDLSTNRLSSTAFSNIYRVTETSSGGSNRAIFANTCSVPVTLGEGTYWIVWQAAGSASYSGPWAPPITINGLSTTGNALQSTDGGVTWPNAQDSGTSTQQGFPFIIEGAVALERSTWSSIKSAF
ncbi:MAG: hypothetical protein K8S24_00280 [Candidatus Aegiribacteria sp.]|nr:hypothetical protein [Candidatus Aegiribacteria sp.]